MLSFVSGGLLISFRMSMSLSAFTDGSSMGRWLEGFFLEIRLIPRVSPREFTRDRNPHKVRLIDLTDSGVSLVDLSRNVLFRSATWLSKRSNLEFARSRKFENSLRSNFRTLSSTSLYSNMSFRLLFRATALFLVIISVVVAWWRVSLELN